MIPINEALLVSVSIDHRTEWCVIIVPGCYNIAIGSTLLMVLCNKGQSTDYRKDVQY